MRVDTIMTRGATAISCNQWLRSQIAKRLIEGTCDYKGDVMAASIKKHPLHPMLVPFPIALWIFSLVCDLIVVLVLGGPVWKDVAFYTMAGGFVGALAAAAPGYLDYR